MYVINVLSVRRERNPNSGTQFPHRERTIQASEMQFLIVVKLFQLSKTLPTLSQTTLETLIIKTQNHY